MKRNLRGLQQAHRLADRQLDSSTHSAWCLALKIPRAPFQKATHHKCFSRTSSHFSTSLIHHFNSLKIRYESSFSDNKYIFSHFAFVYGELWIMRPLIIDSSQCRSLLNIWTQTYFFLFLLHSQISFYSSNFRSNIISSGNSYQIRPQAPNSLADHTQVLLSEHLWMFVLIKLCVGYWASSSYLGNPRKSRTTCPRSSYYTRMHLWSKMLWVFNIL